jgi:hypothetical protein
MAKPTRDEIETLVAAATPQFAFQLRARLSELIAELPADHPARPFAEEQIELLDQLGYASARAEQGEREPRTKPGWEKLPSSAPVSDPLPRRQ